MVARVNRALRDDLGIPKGLADECVVVLDPCCGTGAFLVETLRRIAETESASAGALVEILMDLSAQVARTLICPLRTRSG